MLHWLVAGAVERINHIRVNSVILGINRLPNACLNAPCPLLRKEWTP
jgi:hypothetical protein